MLHLMFKEKVKIALTLLDFVLKLYNNNKKNTRRLVSKSILMIAHWRRMELEDKVKLVAFVWGAEFVQFLAALAVLPWSFWKKRSNSSYFSNFSHKKLKQRWGGQIRFFAKIPSYYLKKVSGNCFYTLCMNLCNA